MRVTMIGTGYVGLVSGACFADFGHTVTCVDKDAGKIARLQKGEIPIFEPGLDELVKDNVEQGRLFFTTDPTQAIREADEIFDGPTVTAEDARSAYGEQRLVTLGVLSGVVVSMTYTERNGDMRIISIRKALKHETRSYLSQIAK